MVKEKNKCSGGCRRLVALYDCPLDSEIRQQHFDICPRIVVFGIMMEPRESLNARRRWSQIGEERGRWKSGMSSRRNEGI